LKQQAMPTRKQQLRASQSSTSLAQNPQTKQGKHPATAKSRDQSEIKLHKR